MGCINQGKAGRFSDATTEKKPIVRFSTGSFGSVLHL